MIGPPVPAVNEEESRILADPTGHGTMKRGNAASGRSVSVAVRDGFGLHVDIAQRDLERRAFLAPTGMDQLQARFPLPETVGCGSLEVTSLAAGISYCRWNCDDAREETRLDTALTPDYVVFPFHLTTEPTEVGIRGVTQPLLLSRSDSYLLGPEVVGTQTIRPGVPIRNLCLFLDVGVVDSCFAEEQRALPAALKQAITHPELEPYYQRGWATAAMGLAVRQMLTCSLTGGLARLYLEAKVLEIAALRLAQLIDDDGVPPPPRLTRLDRERLDHARFILWSRHQDPPTVSELAQLVGLNRTKLKVGFKSRFGTTVFGFIRTQRLQRAAALMQDGECNVSEAAAMVGYNSLSAFGSAFKAEYGICPHQVLGCEEAE
ncbi:MAG: AraC family transcriptional regulator [Spirochaetaceae bacterium]|nr:MAG: AraC family transcriptional regulator [Spirochaetaceae bacterium]